MSEEKKYEVDEKFCNDYLLRSYKNKLDLYLHKDCIEKSSDCNKLFECIDETIPKKIEFEKLNEADAKEYLEKMTINRSISFILENYDIFRNRININSEVFDVLIFLDNKKRFSYGSDATVSCGLCNNRTTQYCNGCKEILPLCESCFIPKHQNKVNDFGQIISYDMSVHKPMPLVISEDLKKISINFEFTKYKEQEIYISFYYITLIVIKDDMIHFRIRINKSYYLPNELSIEYIGNITQKYRLCSNILSICTNFIYYNLDINHIILDCVINFDKTKMYFNKGKSFMCYIKSIGQYFPLISYTYNTINPSEFLKNLSNDSINKITYNTTGDDIFKFLQDIHQIFVDKYDKRYPNFNILIRFGKQKSSKSGGYKNMWIKFILG
jgi:hypothetical protein